MCTSLLPGELARRAHVARPAISTCFTTILEMVRPGGVCAQGSPGNTGPPIVRLPPLTVLRRQGTCGGVWGNHQQLSEGQEKPQLGAGLGGNSMITERDKFFAELDGLTEKEIEARLDLWDREQLALIQEYLDRRVSALAKPATQIEAASSVQDDAVVASLVEVASTANTKATAALILSVGAMLAAMASALVAFLALRGWTISW